MIVALHLAAVLAACQATMWVLARARWTWRAARTAIVTWQAVGLAWALSVVGIPLAFGLESYGTSVLAALPRFGTDVIRGTAPAPGRIAATVLGIGLCLLFATTHLSSAIGAVRTRARHRALLHLVARRDAAAPGVLVLDHPAAAAYCLPGLRSTVVVSAGALALLDGAELAAVLSHERAHAHERHDLVLLPFTAMCAALPWLRWPRTAYDSVALLIEMRADDRALAQHAQESLAAALARFAVSPTAHPPAGALGAAAQLQARIGRLADARRAPRVVVLPALALATALLTMPASLLT